MMYPAQRELVETRPIYQIKAYVYKKGNESWKEDGEDFDIQLDKEDFVLNKNSVTYEGTSGAVIGNAISRVFTLALHNSPRYSAQDFVGAYLNIGAIAPVQSAYSSYSTVQGGDFYVTKVEQADGMIRLTAQDLMINAEKEYKMSLGGASWTLLEIFQDVVNQAFPHPGSSIGFEFLNDSFRVFAKPIGYSCRQMLGFIAQIACGNAFVSETYNGVFFPGDVPVIKTLSTDAPYNQLSQWIEIEDGAETLSISGLKALQTKNINGKDVEPPLEIKSTPYSDAYPLAINNPLITGVEAIAFSRMMPILSNLSFRNFRGKHIGYPLAEYGDYAVITHKDGTFNTFLTNITWNIDGATEFECDIASSADNTADYDDSNGTIEKTESGIQRADLAEDVQASLERADDCRTAEEQNTIDEAIKDRVSTVEEKLGGNGTVGFANVTTASLKTTGEVEIYGDQPHLDFHFGNSADDYTSRIIEAAGGKLNIVAPNGVEINGKKADPEAVTLTVYASRLTNLNYTAKYSELMGAVFVRIYGTINYSMNAGSDYNVLTISSKKPNYIAALACDCAKNCVATARTDSDGNGVIRIRPYDSNIYGNAVYITGFWFV